MCILKFSILESISVVCVFLGNCSFYLRYIFVGIIFRSVQFSSVAQLCPTLCNPMDCAVHGILQARILEWVAFPFSRGSSQPRDRTQVSHTAGRVFTILEWTAYPFSGGSSKPRNQIGISYIADGFFTS